MTPKLPKSERISIANGARPQYDDAGKIIVEMCECGTCRRKWNDALISATTPTPSGRCPYEAYHNA